VLFVEIQVLFVVSAFAVMMLIVCECRHIFSPEPGEGANPPPPRGDDSSTVMPRR
jgi:hypothetical protein